VYAAASGQRPHGAPRTVGRTQPVRLVVRRLLAPMYTARSRVFSSTFTKPNSAWSRTRISARVPRTSPPSGDGAMSNAR
jgi:hypothetical protein